MTWYVVRTKHREEFRAFTNLRQQEGFVPFWPHWMKPRRSNRGRAKIEKVMAPLYPGYVFVDVPDGVPWEPIQSTRGVAHVLVSVDGRPVPVPDDQMQAVFAESDENGKTEITGSIEAKLVAGQIAQFVDGVWAGIRGEVIADETDRGKVQMRLFVQGHGDRVTVPASLLEATE